MLWLLLVQFASAAQQPTEDVTQILPVKELQRNSLHERGEDG